MNNYKKSIFWNSAGSTVFAANSVLMSILITRICGIEITGFFGVGYAAALTLYQIGILGVNNYQSTDFDKKYSFFEYFSVKIISTILMALSTVIVIRFLAGSEIESNIIYLLSAFLLIHSFAGVFESFFFQCRRIDLAGKSVFFRTSISFLFFAATLFFFNSLYLALVSIIISNIITGVFATVIPALKLTKIKISFNCKNIFKLTSECFPIFISSFLMLIVINSSRYILKYYTNSTILGYFNIIFLPNFVISLIGNYIFLPMLPSYADYIKNRNYRGLMLSIIKQCLFILAVFLLGVAVVYLFGIDVLSIVFGKDLRSFKFEMSLVLAGGTIYAITMLFYYILIILRNQALILIGYMFSLSITIFAGLFLVKRYIMVGAIFSFAIGEAFLLSFFIITLLLKLHRLRNPVWRGPAPKPPPFSG
jgi:O-antigen/teichoic acid export membrane protein